MDDDPRLSEISALAVEPGMMGGTGLVRSGSLVVRAFMQYLVPPITSIMQVFSPNGTLRTPYKSGGDLLDAVFDTRSIGTNPKALYLDGSAPCLPAVESRDVEKQRRLWADSVKLANLRDGETVLETGEVGLCPG